MTNNELKAKVTELKELQALIEEAQQQAETIKDELKLHMAHEHAEELHAGLFRVQYKPVIGTRFDKAAMIDRFGEDCYRSFCKPFTSMRFTVA